MSRLIGGILSLKGGEPSDVKQIEESETLKEQSSTISTPKLASSSAKETENSGDNVSEGEALPPLTAKSMMNGVSSTRLTVKPDRTNGTASRPKDEDHDTTSNTSMNGDNSTPAVETSDQSSEDDESILDLDPVPPIKEESEGSSQQGSEDSKTSVTEFTSPGLRWYNPVRRFCGKIVQDEMFQTFVVVLIILNAALMGIGTYDFVEDNPNIQKAFDWADFVFLVVFTIECALQLGYHGYQLFNDGWLTFDLMVVVFSWTMDSVQIFRAMRVFRAFRLVARLAVLKDLVNAIVAVLPRIGSIMLLFSLVLYVYAVMCTILYGTTGYGEDDTWYFGRLDYSLFTLFQFVTLENWGEISREVKAVHPSFAYIVLSFLTLSSFILYSLVVAVVCDAVAVVEHPDIALRNFEEQMKKERSKTKKRVFKLTQHLDDLSQQQMEVLTSVQSSLMKYSSFREDARESQMQAAEMQGHTLHLFGDHDT